MIFFPLVILWSRLNKTQCNVFVKSPWVIQLERKPVHMGCPHYEVHTDSLAQHFWEMCTCRVVSRFAILTCNLVKPVKSSSAISTRYPVKSGKSRSAISTHYLVKPVLILLQVFWVIPVFIWKVELFPDVLHSRMHQLEPLAEALTARH